MKMTYNGWQPQNIESSNHWFIEKTQRKSLVWVYSVQLVLFVSSCFIAFPLLFTKLTSPSSFQINIIPHGCHDCLPTLEYCPQMSLLHPACLLSIFLIREGASSSSLHNSGYSSLFSYSSPLPELLCRPGQHQWEGQAASHQLSRGKEGECIIGPSKVLTTSQQLR